jgi:hypothetical protein
VLLVSQESLVLRALLVRQDLRVLQAWQELMGRPEPRVLSACQAQLERLEKLVQWV